MKKKARIIPIRPDLENDLFDIPDDLREIMKAIDGMQANLRKSSTVQPARKKGLKLTYQFKIKLRGTSKPPVWRRVLIPAHFTFSGLHAVIQEGFGWWNEHLYNFCDVPYSRALSIAEPNEEDWQEPDYNARKFTLGKFVTVMVAGFREAKDQDTVIRAIALLPDEYELWLVGDGVRRPEIESEIVKQNVTKRVKLLGIRSDVPQILKSADVIVMSSHWEGLSLSNIEGMSSGKPFVASEVNGLKEVTAGYGILFPHGDAEALADVIKKLHDDSEYYHQVAERCYQRALQYDIRKMVDAYEQLYYAVQQ